MFNPDQHVFDPTAGAAPDMGQVDQEESDTSRRPPNAFILYSQAMRSQAREENPSLTNTEVSRVLGKMWKEVPAEIKLQYKQKAAAMQEQFKREHPDYTYRKARRKRALNELLSKSQTTFPGQFPGMFDPTLQGQPGFPFMGQNPQFPQMMIPGMGMQGQAGQGLPQISGMGQQMQGMPGLPGMGQQSQMPQMPGMPNVAGTQPLFDMSSFQSNQQMNQTQPQMQGGDMFSQAPMKFQPNMQ